MGSVVICIFIGAFEVNPFFCRLLWWPHPAVDIRVFYLLRKGLPSFNLQMTRFAAIL